MALSDIVQITILSASTAPKQADFGTPLVIGKTPWSDRVRTYNEAADLLADGFVSTDHVYLAVAKIFQQSPRVPSVKVGKRLNLPAPKYRLTPSAQNSTLYRVQVGAGSALANADFTSDATATVAEITAGLKAAIDALAVPGLTTTDNTTSLDLSATAGLWFNFAIDPSMLTRGLLAVLDQTPDAGVAADLDAILNTSQDWYGFSLTVPSTLEIIAAAAWAETNKRLFVPQTIDTGVATLTSGTVADTLKTAGYKYTGLLYSGVVGEMAGYAWIGNRFPLQAGAENWMFAQLVGVTPGQFTATQRSTSNSACSRLTASGVSAKQALPPAR